MLIREESNFHIFYYLYDGLTNKNVQHEYYLDGNLRQRHAYLTADKQDFYTKKVIVIFYRDDVIANSFSKIIILKKVMFNIFFLLFFFLIVA